MTGDYDRMGYPLPVSFYEIQRNPFNDLISKVPSDWVNSFDPFLLGPIWKKVALLLLKERLIHDLPLTKMSGDYIFDLSMNLTRPNV